MTLRRTTDERVTIPLHGPDLERLVRPDTAARVTFQSYATGGSPVAAQGFGERSQGKGQSEEPLVFLEVLPP